LLFVKKTISGGFEQAAFAGCNKMDIERRQGDPVLAGVLEMEEAEENPKKQGLLTRPAESRLSVPRGKTLRVEWPGRGRLRRY